jgi:hypothetical protein
MSDDSQHAQALSRVPRGAVVAGSLAIGIAGSVLIWGTEGPGLNLFLLFVLLAGAVGLVTHRAGRRPGPEALAWMAAGLLFAAAVVLRAAPAVQVISFLAASAAFAFPALRAGASWLRRSGVSDHLEAILGAIGHAGFGPLRMMFARRDDHHDPGPSRLRTTWALLRGLLLAAPLLLVFGALFVSADPVFSQIVTDLFRTVDLEALVSRALLAGVLAWLASGYLSGFVTGTRVRGWLGPAVHRPSVGILEAGTVLSLVGLLFAAFVLVQIRYLFGGSTLVEVTAGLTYSEYAREGFGQLVVAAGLVLPVLLAADWMLRREAPRDAWVFRVLSAAQLLLLLVVIASAFQRLRVYQEAYGLTESRFYGGVFLAWLSLVIAWFAVTILRDRREHFAGPAVVSAFVLAGTLVLVNPDARIARVNLARAASPDASVELDARYLASLSADAVPVLMEALPGLAPEARCTLAGELTRRWAGEADGDWRSWNRSDARARQLLREAPEAHLSLHGCPGPVAPPG